MAPSTPKPDYYKLLQVPLTATTLEIKTAYRHLALLHHPDKHPGCAAATRTMQLLNDAWETLGEPRLRAIYDASYCPPPVFEPYRAPSPPPAPPPAPPSPPPSAPRSKPSGPRKPKSTRPWWEEYVPRAWRPRPGSYPQPNPQPLPTARHKVTGQPKKNGAKARPWPEPQGEEQCEEVAAQEPKLALQREGLMRMSESERLHRWRQGRKKERDAVIRQKRGEKYALRFPMCG